MMTKPEALQSLEQLLLLLAILSSTMPKGLCQVLRTQLSRLESAGH